MGSLSGRARASRIRLATSRRWLLPASCPAPPWAFLTVRWPEADGGRAGTTLASQEEREDRAVLAPERPGQRRAGDPGWGGKIGHNHRSGEGTGSPRSTSEVHAGVGACYRPGAALTARGCRSGPLPDTSPFGPSLSASLACSRMTIGHRRFTYVHLARFLALTWIEASRRVLLSRDFGPHVTSTLRHIVRAALYSGP